MMVFMPESPLFYLTKNKEEEARKSMRFFRGPDFDIEPEMEVFKVSWHVAKRRCNLSVNYNLNFLIKIK